MIKIFGDEENKRFFKNGKYKGRYQITHPDFMFGNYYAYPEDFIYDQKYYCLEYSCNFNDPFDKMMDILKGFEIPLNVGDVFWNIIKSNESYVGSGIYNLYYTKNILNSNQFSILFDFDIGLIVISNNIKMEKLIIKIVASNEIFPYVDVIYPIKEFCINNGFILNSSEFIFEKDVREIELYNDVEIDLFGILLEKRSISLSNGNVNKTVFKYPIIKNTIKESKIFGGLDYILSYLPITDEFYIKKLNSRFSLNTSKWEFGNVNIINNKLMRISY